MEKGSQTKIWTGGHHQLSWLSWEKACAWSKAHSPFLLRPMRDHARSGQFFFCDPVVIELICYRTRANRLINESNTNGAGRARSLFLELLKRSRPEFFSWDSVVYLSCSDNARQQIYQYINIYTTVNLEKVWPGLSTFTYTFSWRLCYFLALALMRMVFPSQKIPSIRLHCSRLSVSLLSYDSRSTLIRLDHRKQSGRVAECIVKKRVKFLLEKFIHEELESGVLNI